MYIQYRSVITFVLMMRYIQYGPVIMINSCNDTDHVRTGSAGSFDGMTTVSAYTADEEIVINFLQV